MAVQLLEPYGCYQARVHPRGPGRTKCFSIAEYGDAGARRRAELWVEQHANPPAPKPVRSARSSSGLAGIGFKWDPHRGQPVLYVTASVGGLAAARSVLQHGPREALIQLVEARILAGDAHPTVGEVHEALRRLRAMLKTGAPRKATT